MTRGAYYGSDNGTKNIIRISGDMVLIPEADYESLLRAKENAEYLDKLDESREQLEKGETISLSMDELRAMESDDWKPTAKVLDWMRRMEEKTAQT